MRLRDVPHHAKFLAIPQPQLEQSVLERGNVLELVHHEVAVIPDLARHVGAIQHEFPRKKKNILEINNVAFRLDILIQP